MIDNTNNVNKESILLEILLRLCACDLDPETPAFKQNLYLSAAFDIFKIIYKFCLKCSPSKSGAHTDACNIFSILKVQK